MGYWKDNFPGSPAYFQRIRVAKFGIAYTILFGGLTYFYSPLSKRLDKLIDAGVGLEPQWLQDQIDNKQGGLLGLPNPDRVGKHQKVHDRIMHQDWTRPRLWERTKGIVRSSKEDFPLPPTETSKPSS